MRPPSCDPSAPSTNASDDIDTGIDIGTEKIFSGLPPRSPCAALRRPAPDSIEHVFDTVPAVTITAAQPGTPASGW